MKEQLSIQNQDLRCLFDKIQNAKVEDYEAHGDILCRLIEQVLTLEGRVSRVECGSVFLPSKPAREKLEEMVAKHPKTPIEIHPGETPC